jgi:hypothetical protein
MLEVCDAVPVYKVLRVQGKKFSLKVSLLLTMVSTSPTPQT